MLPYFILVGVPAFLSMLQLWKKDEKRHMRVIDSFFLILLGLLLVRKETMGIDLYNYSKMFRTAIHTPLDKIISYIVTFEHEIGFFFLAKIVSIFSTDFRVMLSAIALISVIPLWMLYRECSVSHPFLSIAMFLNIGVFSIYFSCLRQVIAMAFLLPAYHYTQQKHPIRFLLTVILAFLFHKSAFIMLFLYPAFHMKIKTKASFMLALPAWGVCYVFRKPLFTFFRSFISEFYTSNLKETGAIAILLLLLMLTFFSYLVTDERKMTPETVGLRNILVFSAILQIFAGVNPLAMRLNYYYLIFIPLIIPKIAECASEKNKTLTQVILAVMVCFFTSYYFYDAYTDVSTLRIYPYIPFWE